jgi:hypothetical protein
MLGHLHRVSYLRCQLCVLYLQQRVETAHGHSIPCQQPMPQHAISLVVPGISDQYGLAVHADGQSWQSVHVQYC